MIHVLYHANCADGFLSRVIAQRKLGFSVSYQAVQYKQPVPKTVLDDLDAEVYILDFSYPREIMERLKSKAKKVVCLDHHKTAQAALEGLDYCKFDMAKSGAMLTWEHFNPDQPAPLLVQYVQDRDLGKPWSDPEHAMPASLQVHAGLFRAHPRTYDCWSSWLDATDLSRLILKGEIITGVDDQINQVIASTPIWIEIDGHVVPAAQIGYEYVSDACAAMLASYPAAPFAVAWFISGERGEVTYSLRARKDGFDVSALAKKFGGGGHSAAAGFTSVQPPQFAHTLS
jgi:uncharacterized protein